MAHSLYNVDFPGSSSKRVAGGLGGDQYPNPKTAASLHARSERKAAPKVFDSITSTRKFKQVVY